MTNRHTHANDKTIAQTWKTDTKREKKSKRKEPWKKCLALNSTSTKKNHFAQWPIVWAKSVQLKKFQS